MTLKGIDFFILGYARSGTSLLRMILNGHPEIKVNPECSFLTFFYNDFKQYSFPLPEKELNSFVQKIVQSRKFETWNLIYEEVLEEIKIKSPNTYGQACALIYKLHGSKNIKYLGDKNNVNIFHQQIIKEIYPNTKFIFIVRDPRDVYNSLVNSSQTANNSKYAPSMKQSISDFGASWNIAYSNFSQTSFETNSNVFLLKYEDLVSSPLNAIRLLLGFIDEDLLARSASLNLAKLHLAGNDEPIELMPWKQRTLQPISTDGINRWKSELSREISGAIYRHCRELMTVFGYEEGTGVQ
jgi:hypothetical protein